MLLEQSYRGARPDASPAAILDSIVVMEQGELRPAPRRPLPDIPSSLAHTLFFLIARRCGKSVPQARKTVKQYFAYPGSKRRYSA
jgi:hypothetical protein